MAIYNPGNPFDTGRPGEENKEVLGRYIQAGRQQELLAMGWDPNAPVNAHDNPNHPTYRGPSAGGGTAGGGAVPGIPGAAVMAQQAAQGLAEYKKALATLNKGRMGTLTSYGYTGDINAETGVLGNMRVDSSNPYGAYQSLRRNNAFQYEDLRDNRMGRGLGAKGLGAQGLDRARHAWGAADTSMAQGLAETLLGYDTSQQSAHQAYQNLLWQLELEASRSLSEAGDFGYAYDSGSEEGTDTPGVVYPEDPADVGPKDRHKTPPKKKGPVNHTGFYTPNVKYTPAQAKAINAKIAAAHRPPTAAKAVNRTGFYAPRVKLTKAERAAINRRR